MLQFIYTGNTPNLNRWTTPRHHLWSGSIFLSSWQTGWGAAGGGWAVPAGAPEEHLRGEAVQLPRDREQRQLPRARGHVPGLCHSHNCQLMSNIKTLYECLEISWVEINLSQQLCSKCIWHDVPGADPEEDGDAVRGEEHEQRGQVPGLEGVSPGSPGPHGRGQLTLSSIK